MALELNGAALGGNERAKNNLPNLEDLDKDAVGTGEDLPSQGSRNATWWYSTYHNVTAIVGAGVLGLPTVMTYLGWSGGALFLSFSWVVTLFTMWQMVQMHEMTDEKGNPERFRTYTQLGQKAFGRKWGKWIVLPQQLTVQVGVNIVYMVTGGQCLWLFYQLLLCPSSFDPVALGDGDQCCGRLGRTTLTIFFAMFQLVFAQFASYHSIAFLSIAASVMSIGYCTIAWVDSVHLGKASHRPLETPGAICPTSYSFAGDRGDYLNPYITPASKAFGVLSSLGVVGFAYGAHNVVLEIQATMPSTPLQPSKFRMWRGVVVAYLIVLICYFPVAFAGYWAFGSALARIGNSTGNPSGGNILLQLGRPKPWIAAANLMVAIHVNGAYQLYAVPVYDLLDKWCLKDPIPPGTMSIKRSMIRSIYVLFTAFIACTFPFFYDLLVFVGGFAIIPGTYFLPCVIWLRIKKPKGVSRFLNWFIIIVGLIFMTAAITGAMQNILVDASTNHSFSYLNCSSVENYPAGCVSVDLPAPSHYTFYRFTCKRSANVASPKCRFHFGH